MKNIIRYIREYFQQTDLRFFSVIVVFTSLLIAINYKVDLESEILFGLSTLPERFVGFYLLYFLALGIPYLFVFLFKRAVFPSSKGFQLLLLIAPAIFSLKVNGGLVKNYIQQSGENEWHKYISIITDMPVRLLIVVSILWLIKKWGKYKGSFWGFTSKDFDWKPYTIMLLIMVPVIALAATQPSFQQAYPKLQRVAFIQEYTHTPLIYNLLYELSYGMDFITIELFFRGFLVLAFARYVGAAAILPMAVFYCSIHFGKPMAECISSFAGGLILGILAYRTQSILGGLMVHLGIAWLMELFGVINY